MEFAYGLLVGYAACFLFPVISLKIMEIKKKLPIIKRWDSITSHTYTNDFSISFTDSFSVADIMMGITDAQNHQIKAAGFKKIKLKAASYRVKVFYKVDFIKNPR